MANKTKIHRIGAGRTKGSTSFILVSLQELNDKIADKNMPVKIGRIWSQPFGFANPITGTASALAAKIDGTAPAQAVAVTVTEL